MINARVKAIFALSTALVLSGCIADRLQERSFNAYSAEEAHQVVAAQHARREYLSLRQAVSVRQPQRDTLSLRDAVTLSVAHSSGIRAKELEAQINKLSMYSSRVDMLPTLKVNSNYFAKNTTSGIVDGVSAEYLASIDTLSFGLNYFQSKQAFYRYGKAQLAAKELSYRIAAEARSYYWQTLVARRFWTKLSGLGAETGAALSRIEAGLADAAVEKRLMLAEKQELLQAMSQAQGFKSSFASAEANLAALMGQGVPPQLSSSDPNSFRKGLWKGRDLEADIREALHNRPEVRTAFYDAGIDNLNKQMEILRSLPVIGATLNAGPEATTMMPSFASLAVETTFNLIKLADLPRKIKSRKLTQELGLAIAKSAGETLALRLILLRSKMKNLDSEWLVAKELDRTQGQILLDTRRRVETGLSSKNRLLITKYDKLITETRLALAASDAATIQFDYSDALGRALPTEQEVSVK